MRILTPTFAFILAHLLAALAYSAPSLNPPTPLKIPALECYRQAVTHQQIFTMNKPYLSDSDIEKLAVGLCTYSDAPGSLRCYRQAELDADVLAASKNTSSVLLMEKKQARLCSNSGQELFNSKTGDADAIDCFKMAKTDSRILPVSKQYMNDTQLEEVIVKLCISSNGLGAQQCFLKSKDKAEGILDANHLYSGPTALENTIVDLCKGTRLR